MTTSPHSSFVFYGPPYSVLSEDSDYLLLDLPVQETVENRQKYSLDTVYFILHYFARLLFDQFGLLVFSNNCSSCDAS